MRCRPRDHWSALLALLSSAQSVLPTCTCCLVPDRRCCALPLARPAAVHFNRLTREQQLDVINREWGLPLCLPCPTCAMYCVPQLNPACRHPVAHPATPCCPPPQPPDAQEPSIRPCKAAEGGRDPGLTGRPPTYAPQAPRPPGPSGPSAALHPLIPLPQPSLTDLAAPHFFCAACSGGQGINFPSSPCLRSLSAFPSCQERPKRMRCARALELFFH